MLSTTRRYGTIEELVLLVWGRLTFQNGNPSRDTSLEGFARPIFRYLIPSATTQCLRSRLKLYGDTSGLVLSRLSRRLARCTALA